MSENVQIKTTLQYLDKRFVGQGMGQCQQEEGASRSDTISVDVAVRDGRCGVDGDDKSYQEQLDHVGFCLATMTSEEHSRFQRAHPFRMNGDIEVVNEYYRAMEQVVLRHTNAVFCKTFNYVLRDSSIAGVNTRANDDNEPRGSINNIHCDFTPRAPAVDAIRHALAQMGFADCRFSVLNCWRNADPEPVAQWPMAVCDCSSVNKSDDLIERHTVENDNVIYNVLPNPAHRWYTYPGMTDGEVLLFKQYDSDINVDPACACFVPHTAFKGVVQPGAPVRRSCEVRVLCVFADPKSCIEVLRVIQASGEGTVAPWALQANEVDVGDYHVSKL